jgi:diketogulonate reductase-like aldo/keto reductase
MVKLRGKDNTPCIDCPALAFGTGTKWGVGVGGNDKPVLDRTLIDAIKDSLKAGFTHIDTAEVCI